VSLVIVPYGGVADIGLSSYSPFRRRAANLSDLKTSNNRFRAFNLGPRVHETALLTTVAGRLVTPVDDGFVDAVCAGH
jgi:hypothetical protein